MNHSRGEFIMKKIYSLIFVAGAQLIGCFEAPTDCKSDPIYCVSDAGSEGGGGSKTVTSQTVTGAGGH